jgi:hypothetical protein
LGRFELIMKKILLISIVVIAVLLSGCIEEEVTGTGKITDKWSSTVRDGYGSRDAFYFEINNTFYLEVGTFDYHNFEINQTYHYSGILLDGGE